MAKLAYQQSHFTRAMDYAWLALEAQPDNQAALQIFVDAATASNNAESARVLLKKHSTFPPKPASIEQLVLDTPAVIQGKLESKSPLKQAEELLKDDLTLRLEKLRDGKEGDLKKIAEDGELQLNVETDHFVALPFKPNRIAWCRFG